MKTVLRSCLGGLNHADIVMQTVHDKLFCGANKSNLCENEIAVELYASCFMCGAVGLFRR